MGGIEHVAGSISVVLHERLPWQRKTQRENLALLVATMLSERSANLMSLAAALPRQPDRIDMRYQWIVRVLANPLIECDAVMLAFAREVLARAQAEAGPGERVDLILDQSRASERHQILMLALRWGERALPLAWRVEETEGAIGFGVQKGLLDTVVAWLPEEARVRLLGDRFYGTPALIAHCQVLGWDYRLRLKGNLRVWLDGADAGSVEKLARDTPYLTGVELTARRVRTNVGLIQDPGHEEPWIVAMSEDPRATSPRSTTPGAGALSQCSPTSKRVASAWKTARSASPTGWPGSSWSWRWHSTSPCPQDNGMRSIMPRLPNADARNNSRRTSCAA